MYKEEHGEREERERERDRQIDRERERVEEQMIKDRKSAMKHIKPSFL